MASVTGREANIDGTTGRFHIFCPESLVLPDCFGVSLAFVVHSMNSTKDQRVFSLLTSELMVDEREREASTQAGEGEGTP